MTNGREIHEVAAYVVSSRACFGVHVPDNKPEEASPTLGGAMIVGTGVAVAESDPSNRGVIDSMRLSSGLLSLVCCVSFFGLVFSCRSLYKPSTPERLPVFRLASPRVEGDTAQSLMTGIFGLVAEVKEDRDGLELVDGSKRLALDRASGAVWADDRSQLFNPEPEPALPSPATVERIAGEFYATMQLLPQASTRQPVQVARIENGSTRAAVFTRATGERRDKQLDVQVRHVVRIQAGETSHNTVYYPLVGGGGEFNLSLGDGGAIVGYSGLWREILGIEAMAPVVSRAKADRQFEERTRGMKIRSRNAFLAYYSAPTGVAQEIMAPVWVYRASAEVEGRVVPLRLIYVSATALTPGFQSPARMGDRPPDSRPRPEALGPEGPEEGGVDAGFVYSPAPRPETWREAGTSFIGSSGGLSGSFNNANGFVNRLAGEGWITNFNWGDYDAWESDWRAHDDEWVDSADFVFYTGHASMDGWILSQPDDGSLSSSEVDPISPRDLWGGQDLEWVIVAACGPLQDDAIVQGGGDVFSRWGGAFDGLHQLLGYGAVTYDNEEEGDRVARYTLAGDKVIDAWFRTARENQDSTNGFPPPNGPTIWVGVLFAGRTGKTSPGNDHIWKKGPTASDPVDPDYYIAMWTTT